MATQDEVETTISRMNAVSLSPSTTTVFFGRMPTDLPDEIIEQIILDVWLTRDIDHDVRWSFYKSMLLLCKQWRRIMLHVRFRWIVLDSLEDCTVYETLMKQLMEDIGWVDEATQDRIEDTTNLSYSSLDGMRASRVWGLRLDSPLHRKLNPESPLASHPIFELSDVRAHYDLALPASEIIPNCRSLKVTVRSPGTLYLIDKWSQFRSLDTFSIEFLQGSSILAHDERSTLQSNKNITSFHLHYPQIFLLNSPKEMIRILSDAFPNVTSLRLSGPLPLIHVSGSFPKMHTVILESPLEQPFKRTEDGVFDHYYAMHWTIVGGVNSGLFARSRASDEERNRIILHAAASEPKNWDKIVQSCRNRHVEAKHYAVYF